MSMRNGNGTIMLSLSSYQCRHRRQCLRYFAHCCPSLFTLFILVVSVFTAEGASVTGAHHTNQEAIISTSPSTTSTSSLDSLAPSSFSGNHDPHQQKSASVDQHHGHVEMLVGTSSFVTKIGNGFERLVVSIDDTLALLSQSSSLLTSTTSTTTSASTTSSSAQIQHQHECQTVLEQLKELISRTSDYLYKATKGQTYFRQVSLLLPPSWANVNCTGSYQGASRHLFPAEEALTTASISKAAVHQAQITADIHVTTDHPVYIDRPWTLQYGGCGVPGKKISIPISFLTTGVLGPQGELKARLLVREWVKYRYGVFDESGFSFDEKYPLEYVDNAGKQVATSCHLNTTNCAAGEKCNSDELPFSSTTSSTNGPLSKQTFSPEDVLSLMSLPLDSKVNEFCDDHTHVRTTPTKHNFLCDGQSIWGVMRKHPDFKQNSASSTVSSSTSGKIGSNAAVISAPATSFSFVTPKRSRVIFLLDRTQSMNQNDRWTNLRRAMYRMFHHIPTGVELGVISYTNVSAVSLPLTVTGPSNRDTLHGRVPLRPLTTLPEDACVSCALKTAIKLLKAAGESSSPANIILFSGSSKLSTKEWEKVSRILDSNGPLRVIVVSYDDSVKSVQYRELSKHGEIIRISDSDLHSRSKNLEQSVTLNNVFLKLINELLGSPVYKVHESIQWPNSEWQVRGKFAVEDSLGQNTWVTVTPEEHGDVDGLQLISPTGKEYDLPLNAEGMTFLRVPGIAESGFWSYTVRYYYNQQARPISIDVVTEAKKNDAIHVKFWNNVVSGGSNSNVHGATEVVTLFAQVLQGELPLLNGNVTATIRLPSGSPNHSGQQLIRVPLLDTGSGDPDITWGDGIYSAYFTQLGPMPGLFGVSVQVNDNNGQAVVPVHTNITRGSYDKTPCCGSSVPHIATIPTGTFNRHMIGSSFTIRQGIPLGEDPYPPSRVTDLRIERVVDSASEIKLSWTAPGGDFDKGQSSKYEIRCYTSRDALTNENFVNQGILVHSSLTPEPEPYGVRQSSIVAVPWENDYFYYGIVAIDSALNRGKVSNLVSVFIKETPTSTVKLTDAWEDDALVSNLTSSRSLNLLNQNNNQSGVFNVGATWFRGLNETELYVVLAGAAVLLILISTMILALACVKRNKKKSSESPPAYHNIYSADATSKSQNGRFTPTKKGNDDGMVVVGCCWENESTNSSKPDAIDHQTVNHINSSQQTRIGPNSISKMSSYIPASALYPPTLHTNNNGAANNGQYRDIYSSGNNDSGSVGSKPSDGGSEATTHLTHDSNNLHIAPNNGSISPSYYPMCGLNTSSSMDPLTTNGNGVFSTPRHGNNPTSPPQMSTSPSSEDEEGGFNRQYHQNPYGDIPFHHSQHSLRTRDGGIYMGSSISRVSVPTPSVGTIMTSSQCEQPSPCPNGSYGGSIMSIPNNHGGSQKKRTRHISFV